MPPSFVTTLKSYYISLPTFYLFWSVLYTNTDFLIFQPKNKGVLYTSKYGTHM
jgi:hypothetical protein